MVVSQERLVSRGELYRSERSTWTRWFVFDLQSDAELTRYRRARRPMFFPVREGVRRMLRPGILVLLTVPAFAFCVPLRAASPNLAGDWICEVKSSEVANGISNYYRFTLQQTGTVLTQLEQNRGFR